jgi:hypothetical protein
MSIEDGLSRLRKTNIMEINYEPDHEGMCECGFAYEECACEHAEETEERYEPL